MFNGDATETRMCVLLNEVGATARSGPGAIGVYRLETDGAGDDEDLRRVFATVKSAAEIFSGARIE